MPANIYVDRGNGDIHVADGEGTNSNQRIAVMNSGGALLRHWRPDGMESVHCMTVSNDGIVYVCNRTGSRVQLYDKYGAFKRNIEVPWIPATPPAPGAQPQQSGGSAVALEFSPGPEQRLMYVINQNNSRIEIFERETGRKLGSFGQGGTAPGELNQPHAMAVDSQGNVYIADQRGGGSRNSRCRREDAEGWPTARMAGWAASKRASVMPPKAGIHGRVQAEGWIPIFAGMMTACFRG